MCARAARPGMGIATDITVKNKRLYRDLLGSFSTGEPETIRRSVLSIFDERAEIKASHPINSAQVGIGYFSDIVVPLMGALKGLNRQNYVVVGGEYLGTEWVTSTGYYYGHFTHPLFGIPPSGKLAFLRFGEFHRIEEGKILESQIFLGLAELIIALGLWPLGTSQGYEGVVPGPSTQDGINFGSSDPAKSRDTANLVEDMLLSLATEDCAWRPYWDDRMVWYGPGGFGSYATVDAFGAFQRPFEQAFEGWGDGQNEGIGGVGSSGKAGDGEYAFLNGWPQITGIHVDSFMGIAPTHKRVFMRDCDWWRCEGGKIIENWCMVDTLHLTYQLGRDVLAELSA